MASTETEPVERLLAEDCPVPRREVLRLLDDVNAAVRDRDRAFRMDRSRPDVDAIGNLKDRFRDIQRTLSSIQDEISSVLASKESQPVADARRYRWGNDVRRALVDLSGIGLAMYNMLDPSKPELTSIIGFDQVVLQELVSETTTEKKAKGLVSVGEEAKDKLRALRERFRGG